MKAASSASKATLLLRHGGARPLLSFTCERGELDEAERLAREAVAVAQKTDALAAHGDAFYDLAEVLAAQDDREAALAALNDALESYERKGIIPLARRTRERLAATKATTP